MLGEEQLNPELLAEFKQLVQRTSDASVKRVLERYQVQLVSNAAVREISFQRLTMEQLVKEPFNLLFGDAAALEEFFHRRAGAGGAGSGESDTKSFAAMDVVRPSRHFYVRPPELNSLCALLKDERYVVVCSGRQTGKSTLAYALADELRQQAAARGKLVRVFYVQFNKRTMECKDSASFWTHMAHELLLQAAKRQVVPQRFLQFQQAPNQANFVLALEKADCDEWFLFDEAGQVADVDTYQQLGWCLCSPRACGEFVDALRQLKNTQDTTLQGVVLFGVHNIKRMLHEENTRRKRGAAELQENISLQDQAQAEEHSRPAKKHAAALEYGHAAVQGAKGSSSALPVPVPPAAVASYSGNAWTMPPFRAQLAPDLQPFTVQVVSQLLQQYVSEAQAAGADCLAADQVNAVAESIIELTAGVKGLAGFCLQRVGNALEPLTTAAEWARFSRFQLVASLTLSPLFKRVAGILADVFPSRQEEQQLQWHLPHWSKVQFQQAVIMSVLHSGQRVVPREHLAELTDLFAEGLLVVQPQAGLTGAQQLTDDTLVEPVTVQLAAPVLAACLLRRLTMVAVVKEDPPGGPLEMMWLPRQVLKNLDLECLENEQALLASGKTAESEWQDTFQCQTYLLVYTILRLAQQPYSVVGEARAWRSDATRRRLDLLLCGEGGDKARYGLELLANGTTATIKEHWQRAILYSQLHAQMSEEQSTPCKMYVVNFECPAASRPTASATAFAADTWAPAFPAEHPDVTLVHIMVDRVEKVAWVATQPPGAACIKERVPVEHVSASGARRVYRRSMESAAEPAG